eukprot:8801402-Alexandrium_andersonii.AAC.1
MASRSVLSGCAPAACRGGSRRRSGRGPPPAARHLGTALARVAAGHGLPLVPVAGACDGAPAPWVVRAPRRAALGGRGGRVGGAPRG